MPPAADSATLSDEQLACRAQAGCRASFEQLLRRFQVPVLQFLRRRTSASEAEDLTQEAFLRAYENLHRYSDRWPVSAWLFTIARRVAINHDRRRRPAAGIAAMEAVVSAEPEPHRAAQRRESRGKLWGLAAAALSDEQLTALWLYYAEGLPVEQIARVLRRSRASVKVLMFRARRKLRPIFEKSDLLPEGDEGEKGAASDLPERPAGCFAHVAPAPSFSLRDESN